ncbi:hypothetical protein RJ639_041986 [Escallonia herrerae]|uniref:Uncharacterized protein n=1 Tax=Escallonia herrerae TaxID=1293975 RepID=A0AA88WMR1_9ASTE|nr:hypothetical protein RJ639_041986 [Escallonia herrerae]
MELVTLHVYQFETNKLLLQVSDVVMCPAFLTTSRKKHFVSSHIRRKNSTSLNNMVQEKNESLSHYLGRFITVMLEIDNLDESVNYTAFLYGLQPISIFAFSVNKITGDDDDFTTALASLILKIGEDEEDAPNVATLVSIDVSMNHHNLENDNHKHASSKEENTVSYHEMAHEHDEGVQDTKEEDQLNGVVAYLEDVSPEIPIPNFCPNSGKYQPKGDE